MEIIIASPNERIIMLVSISIKDHLDVQIIIKFA